MLLNPPEVTSGARTRNAVALAARILGYDAVEVVNLCVTASRSVVELNAGTDRGWAEAREDIGLALSRASGLLGGWGVRGLTGQAARTLDHQLRWLHDEALDAGISSIWMVGGAPRHPSRWHQYVSDKHGRTAGGSFDQRLAQVLREVPLRGDHQLTV